MPAQKELVKRVLEWQKIRPQKSQHKMWAMGYFERYALRHMPEKSIYYMICVGAES